MIMRTFLCSVLLSTMPLQASGYVYEDGTSQERRDPALLGLLEGASSVQIGRHIEILFDPQALYEFYARRSFMPAWHDRKSAITLIDTLVGASKAGLNPANPDYHLNTILALMEEADFDAPSDIYRSDARTVLDLLLSDAFMALGTHLHFGMSYGLEVSGQHAIEQRRLDMPALLEMGLEQSRIAVTLANLEPLHEGYRRLKEALQSYRVLARSGGWEEVGVRTAGNGSAAYEHTTKLKARLELTGDYIENGHTEQVRHDTQLTEAIVRFQKRHGLEADGVVGPQTLSMLNRPVEEKIRTIMMNLERWKWLPEVMPQRYLLVNIPGFRLDAVEAGQSMLDMKVIVGRHQRQTPTFDAQMTHMVFNPYWRIPRTILMQDLLPKLKKDPAYLQSKRITLFDANDSLEQHPIDPLNINWKEMQGPDMLAYTFRQEPGPSNPLGFVKFIFPNPYDVYIHDTPAKEKFDVAKSMFSSGCIRVKKPIELAAYLLKQDYPNLTYRDIFDEIFAGSVRKIPFSEALPVFITYQTAWVDDEGRVQFRDDVYGSDADLLRLLSEKL